MADVRPLILRIAEHSPVPAQDPATTRPTATVVVAVHNAQSHVHDLMESLRTLDHPSFDVVIVDDGSTDATGQILSEIDVFPVPLLILAVEENIGVARARNLALRHATGSYIWMVDGDDHWPSDALRILCNAAESTGSDLVIAQATRVIEGSDRTSRIPAPRSSGLLAPEDLVSAYLRGDVQGQLWNKLFARDVICGQGDVFPPMRSKSDVCGLVSILRRVGRAVVIEDDVYTYLFHSGSIATSQARPLDLIRVAEVTYRELGDRDRERTLWDLFWLRSISVPLLTEVWRFDDRSPAADYARRVVRSGLGLRPAVRLARAGEYRAAALSLALGCASGIVRRVYVRRRRSEWAS